MGLSQFHTVFVFIIIFVQIWLFPYYSELQLQSRHAKHIFILVNDDHRHFDGEAPTKRKKCEWNLRIVPAKRIVIDCVSGR